MRGSSSIGVQCELRRFHRWVFDQLDVPDRARLLEVGCGSWAPLGCKQGADASRLGSLSLQLLVGMISAARSRLGVGFRLEVADAEALPRRSGTFHAAIANHMLYHVQNRPRAIRELARVLRPDGPYDPCRRRSAYPCLHA